MDDMETVFLSGIHSHDRNIILKYCIEKNVRVYVIPRVGDVLMSGATQVHLFHLPMLRIGRYEPNPEYLFFKRLFDLIMSVTGIVILSPLMLLTALAIKLYDRGPVFYAQTRLTKDGKEQWGKEMFETTANYFVDFKKVKLIIREVLEWIKKQRWK